MSVGHILEGVLANKDLQLNEWVYMLSSELCIRSGFKYLEIKAEILIYCLRLILSCQTQMLSFYSRDRGIYLTVLMLL